MRTEACRSCYQKNICAMVDHPNMTSAVVDGRRYKPGLTPNCFFHCCRTGVDEALKAYMEALRSEESGYIPFRSDHKPFVDRDDFAGRYVVCGDVPGFEEGDVVVRIEDNYKKLTNVFYYEPRRQMTVSRE